MKALIIMGLIACLSGCAGHGGIESTLDEINRELESTNSHHRYALVEYERFYKLEPVWAGEPATSVADASLRKDVFAMLKKHCELHGSQLTQTRVVEMAYPVIKEVWLFNDTASERPDTLTGISIGFEVLPDNGGVNITIYSGCHSKPMPEMVHAK